MIDSSGDDVLILEGLPRYFSDILPGQLQIFFSFQMNAPMGADTLPLKRLAWNTWPLKDCQLDFQCFDGASFVFNTLYHIYPFETYYIQGVLWHDSTSHSSCNVFHVILNRSIKKPFGFRPIKTL